MSHTVCVWTFRCVGKRWQKCAKWIWWGPGSWMPSFPNQASDHFHSPNNSKCTAWHSSSFASTWESNLAGTDVGRSMCFRTPDTHHNLPRQLLKLHNLKNATRPLQGRNHPSLLSVQGEWKNGLPFFVLSSVALGFLLGCSCWHNATRTLDLAKVAILLLPGSNLTRVAVCTLSHQYWHRSHRWYVTILNCEVISDFWMSGKEDNVQPNVGDMIMNRIFWLVNISCIVEPNFMVCGCLFTSRIPYIIEVVSGSFPNPSWIIQICLIIYPIKPYTCRIIPFRK